MTLAKNEGLCKRTILKAIGKILAKVFREKKGSLQKGGSLEQKRIL